MEDQVTHALAFASVVSEEPSQVADLGSGGGLPALVLATQAWSRSTFTLIESRSRRCEFLREAAAMLGIAERIRVFDGRAEEAGHDTALRGQVDVVVSRSFGRPAVTAECAAPLLRVGGLLVVSEPPQTGSDTVHVRWPGEGIEKLGLELMELRAGPPAMAVLRQRDLCAARYPRRVGIPEKRPLFE